MFQSDQDMDMFRVLEIVSFCSPTLKSFNGLCFKWVLVAKLFFNGLCFEWIFLVKLGLSGLCFKWGSVVELGFNGLCFKVTWMCICFMFRKLFHSTIQKFKLLQWLVF
jgi:hypothetical protein